MRNESNKTFLVVFIAMFLAGAALVLSIPALFGPHEPHQVSTTVVLGGLWTVLAVGTLYLHPTRSSRFKRNTGDEQHP